MKKTVMGLMLFGMVIFSGCSSDTTNDNLGVLDEDKPRITLYGDKEIVINLGTNRILENDNFIAEDSEDGDLTASVKRTHNIDFTKVGVYQVTYFVEDSDGFTDTQTRTVKIVNPNDNNLSTDNQDHSGDIDLGTTTDNNQNGYDNNPDLGTPIDGDGTITYSDIENFTTWYYNTCGETFNEALYNSTTKSYSGKIDCSNKGLDYIDLNTLSLFNSINIIDLSHNNLTDIDFTPIQNIQGLNYLYINNNTTTLKRKYDTASERNALFRFFTNIHGGDGKTGLFIGFKPNAKETLRISF